MTNLYNCTRIKRSVDLSKKGMRKVVAQEINEIEGLQRLYSNVLNATTVY